MSIPLILVPTSAEYKVIAASVARAAVGRIQKINIQQCGFGPVAAAARTSQLIAESRPAWVVLVGIAGALSEDGEVGAAYLFDRVTIDGVGAGCGSDFRSAVELGWGQATSLGLNCPYDSLPLTNPDGWTENRRAELVTVCAASANETEAAQRRVRFPHAVAEDMEGFAVALACALNEIPFSIVRGISNRAGNRDHQDWCIPQALAAAAEAVCHLIATPDITRSHPES